jgi:hypothetical protein
MKKGTCTIIYLWGSYFILLPGGDASRTSFILYPLDDCLLSRNNLVNNLLVDV